MSDSISTVSTQANTEATADRERRQRVLKKGIVSYNDGSITSEVIVRDLSSKGVKLKQTNFVPMPDHVTLEIPMDGIKVDCEVRWRSGDTLGVLFLTEPVVRHEAHRAKLVPSSAKAGATLRKKI